jgi:hypothetical protein
MSYGVYSGGLDWDVAVETMAKVQHPRGLASAFKDKYPTTGPPITQNSRFGIPFSIIWVITSAR